MIENIITGRTSLAELAGLRLARSYRASDSHPLDSPYNCSDEFGSYLHSSRLPIRAEDMASEQAPLACTEAFADTLAAYT